MLDEAWTTTSTFFNTHPTEVGLGAVSVAVLLGLCWSVREVIRAKDQQYLREYVPRIRTKALTSARNRFVDDLFANKIKFVIEKAIHDQEITRFEANIRYRRLNKGFRHKNFIPNVFLLKDALKARRQAKVLHPPKSIVASATNVVKGAFGDKSVRSRSPKSA